MPSIITGSTYETLANAKISKPTLVSDDHPALAQDQKDLLAEYKAAFGCQEAESTFKLIDKDGERAIYYPSVIRKGTEMVIEWGGKTFPLPPNAKFDAGIPELYVIKGTGEEAETYNLKVRVAYIKPEDATTKTQKEYSLLPKDQRASFLTKAWDKGTLVHLLAEGFPTVLKLGEVGAGEYKVVETKMNRFDKYELKLDDGRWIRSNTAIYEKLELFKELNIEVSEKAPATLTIEPSTKKTQTGYDIYPVSFKPFKSASIPVFDFSSAPDDSTAKDNPLTPEEAIPF